MTNKTLLLGPGHGPGPWWEATKVSVLAGGTWHSFEYHTLSISEDGMLVLRRAEKPSSDDQQLSFTAIAAFPEHGWQGVRFDDARPDDRAIAQYGFKPSSGAA